MQVRDITERDYEIVAAELRDLMHRGGPVESVQGLHPMHGRTLLVRDASRCMILVEDATGLDRMVITNAFIEGGAVLSSATVAGRC